MSKVDLVIGFSERVRESQGIVAPAPAISFPLESIGVVADVVANSMPGQLLRSIPTQLGEAQDSHTLVIERIGLGQVQDIELNCLIPSSIAHSEKEPLCVPISVNVVLKNHIIFVIADFH